MGRPHLTAHDKKKLFEWHDAQNPLPKQREIEDWAMRNLKCPVSQSTISRLFKQRRAGRKVLDLLEKRKQLSRWPELEAAMYSEILAVENAKGMCSLKGIRLLAMTLWKEMPQYKDLPVPNFTKGWIGRFQQRHNFFKRKNFGSSGGVPPGAEDQMKKIR